MSHFPRRNMCKTRTVAPLNPFLCVLSPSLVILHFMPLSFPVLPRWDGARTKPFSLPPRRAFPPRSLPGIPESILAIENVKNEGRAGEGARSAPAGRVLPSCSRGPKSPQVIPEYQRPFSLLRLEAQWSKPPYPPLDRDMASRNLMARSYLGLIEPSMPQGGR